MPIKIPFLNLGCIESWVKWQNKMEMSGVDSSQFDAVNGAFSFCVIVSKNGHNFVPQHCDHAIGNIYSPLSTLNLGQPRHLLWFTDGAEVVSRQVRA